MLVPRRYVFSDGRREPFSPVQTTPAPQYSALVARISAARLVRQFPA